MGALDTVGGRLRLVLTEQGWDHAHFAKVLGIHPKTLSRWINDHQPLDAERIGAIARALDISPAWLAEGRGSPTGAPDEWGLGVSRPNGVSPAGVSTSRGPRRAENMPHAVRVWLKEFELELTKAGASDEELQAAIALVTAPEVFTYFSRTGPREYGEEDVIVGMEALAQVVRRELKKRGKKFR